jgi:excinuclease ABC subunit B
MNFQVVSDYQPKGDQPQAIEKLTQGIIDGEQFQTLLGVTGSGKTFTVANVIEEVQRPTLVLAHNKTLAAQLYSIQTILSKQCGGIFCFLLRLLSTRSLHACYRSFIEKDLSINEELEKMRMSTTASFSGRRDILVVASVSCLYGIGNPVEFQKNLIPIEKGQIISRTKLLHQLVQSLYSRTEADFNPGNFRIKGDTVDIYPSYADEASVSISLVMKSRRLKVSIQRF